MTRPAMWAKARRLHGEGLTPFKISLVLGCDYSSARYAVDEDYRLHKRALAKARQIALKQKRGAA